MFHLSNVRPARVVFLGSILSCCGLILTSLSNTIINGAPGTKLETRVVEAPAQFELQPAPHTTAQDCPGLREFSLMVVHRTQTSLTLVWIVDGEQPPEFEVKYKQADNPDDDYHFLPRLSGSEREVTLRNLEPGTRYIVRVRGICSDQSQSLAELAIGTTVPLECETVDERSLFARPVFDTSAHIEWNGVLTAESYKVELFSADGHSLAVFRPVREEQEIDRLSPATEYEVRVTTTCDEAGNLDSPTYASVRFRTADGPPPTNCKTPANFQVRNVSAVNAEAVWEAVTQPPEYTRIHYALDIVPLELDNPPIGEIDITSWQLLELTPNTNYQLRVRTLCENPSQRVWAYSEWTPVQQITTKSCDPPTGIREADPTYNSAKLQWDPVSFPFYRWIVEYRSTAPGQPQTWLEKSTDYNDSKTHIGAAAGMAPLIPGSPYEYQVTTQCGKYVWSLPSSPMSKFVTDPCPPPDPATMEAINISVTSAKLKWTPAGDANDVRYRKFCRDCSDQQAPWQEIRNITDGTKAISGLISGTKYEFQVRSVCAQAQPTAWSPSATFRTLDCTTAVPNVSLTNVEKNSALIQWPEVKGATYYQYRIKKEGENYSAPFDLFINFQTLGGLEKCTTYVVQVRSSCSQPGDPNPTFSDWATNTFTTAGCVCENPMITHAEGCSRWFKNVYLGAPNATSGPWEVRWATKNIQSNQWRFHWQECGNFNPASCTGPINTITNYTFRKEKTCSINRHVDYFVYGVTMTLFHYYRFDAQYLCDNGTWSSPVGEIYQVILVPNLNVTNLSSTSATISWEPLPEATGYVISYGPQDTEPSGGTTVGPQTNSFILKNLDPATAYEIEVTAMLPGGNMSIPATKSITTASGSCRYSVSPASASAEAAGGSGSVAVTSGALCAWTATSAAPWLTITSGAKGSGNGTVAYSVSANTGAEPRTGTLTIAGNAVAITQNGGLNPIPSIFNLNPTSAVAGGGPLTLSVSGSGFTSSSLVQVNGSNRNTTFQNAGLLSAVIPSSDLVNPFSLVITVFNPTPGGGLSNPVSLAVTTPTGCTRNAPTVSISPSDQRGYGGQHLTYRLTITNNDSPQCSVNSFDVRPTFPASGWGQSPISTTFLVMPGESAWRDVEIWSAPTAPYITHTFRQTATSWLGPSASGEATYTVYSLMPPDTCGRANPTVTISPADQRGYGGQQLTYRVSITNNDSPLCSVRGFDVTPTFPGPGWGQSPASMGFVIASGETAWRDVLVWSSPGAAFTSHTFTETATSGIEYAGSGQATYTVYDLMPPDTCGRANPTVTVTPNYQSGTQAQRLSYWVTVKNNDAPACGGSSFTVTPTMPVVTSGYPWTHVPEDYFTLFAVPGESSTREINVISASLADMGENTITWTASHTRYQSGSGQAVFNVIPYWEARIWKGLFPEVPETDRFLFPWNRMRWR
jgi:hypothetical protein